MLLMILIILVTCFYIYISKCLSYWEVRDTSYIKPAFISNLFSKKLHEQQLCGLYNTFSNKRYYGQYILLRPVLVIRDPELIRKITVKWFNSFGNNKDLVPRYIDSIWSKNIFATKIEDGWYGLRTTLSPYLTSGKLRAMFELIQKCAEECGKYYEEQGGIPEIEAGNLFSRFAIDVIGSTVYGISCNSFQEPENKFYLMGKQVTDFSGLKAFRFLGYVFCPRIMQLCNIRVFDKHLVTFFRGVMYELLRQRKEKNLIRPGLLQSLMEEQSGGLKHESGNISSQISADDKKVMKQKKKATLSDVDIMGIALGFFVAGSDTVTNTLSFIAHELTLNPDVQEKLYQEIVAAPKDINGKLTYEVFERMKYLDMVISESMRMWPLTSYMNKECRIPFTLEPENEDETPLLIEKGMHCLLTIFAMHRDPKYFPNPEKFDPERFNDENKRNIKPFTYIPFGVGPRNCLGMRFALLEIKVILAEIVQKFKIIPAKKTTSSVSLKRKGFVMYPEKGIWFGLKPRINSEE